MNHAAPYFDDDQRPTLAVDPVYPGDDQGESADDVAGLVREARAEGIGWALEILNEGTSSPEEIGLRAVLLQFVMFPGQASVKSIRALASRLGIPRSSVHLKLQEMRSRLKQ